MCDYAIANGLVQVNPAASLPMRFMNVENLATERKVIFGIFPRQIKLDQPRTKRC